MAYDPTVTALYGANDGAVNFDETEVRDAGGFAYFWIGEDGKPYPWKQDAPNNISTEVITVEHNGQQVEVFTKPNIMFAGDVESKLDVITSETLQKCSETIAYREEIRVVKDREGHKVSVPTRIYYEFDTKTKQYVEIGTIDTNNKQEVERCDAKYGTATESIEAEIFTKDQETTVTKKGIHYSKIDIVTAEGKATTKITYYAMDEQTGQYKVIETVYKGTEKAQKAKELYGEPELSSTGKYLVGEHNVRYVLREIAGKLVSIFNITDISRFPFNTISKGIIERFGEIATAGANVRNAVEIKVNAAQFHEVFMEAKEGVYIPRIGKETIADAFIDQLTSQLRKTNQSGSPFIYNGELTINGINIIKFRTSTSDLAEDTYKALSYQKPEIIYIE
jgi:hypothetical protein